MEKKRYAALIPAVFVLLLAVCCGQTREAEEEQATGIVIREKDGRSWFSFQDEEEKEYEALLLEGAERCRYHFHLLETDQETGWKRYTDPEAGISSKAGIDVSEFQGEDIDWQQVKESGIQFVIIRAGYRVYGEGGELVPDAMFEQNIQGALDAGLEVGVYFFSQAVSAAEAVEEAEFVLDQIRPYEISGPVVYDTEEIKWDEARTDDNTRQEFTNFCKIFCDTMEYEGYESMIYADLTWMAFTLDMEELTEYEFWYPDYHELPQCPYDYRIWQYSDTGSVPGINGNVNLNIWFQEDAG